MTLTFLGAAREVTGSCYLLETAGQKILIDCGMIQGQRFDEQRNHDPFPFELKTIDAVLVSHPHLDHVGRIPKLAREGFAGPIFMTKGACELARLIWDDAYQVMAYNHRKFGESLLFSLEDIEQASQLLRGVDYHAPVPIGGGIEAVWRDAGHIFGSAFIEIVSEGKRIVFSGDIGNADAPILKDTESLPKDIDALVCESTYGDRVHESRVESDRMLRSLISDGIRRGGTILMPTFSLERTQEIIYRLHEMIEHEKSIPLVPIFLDSPLAIRATEVYKKYPEYYDDSAAAAYRMRDDFLNFPTLRLALSKEESKSINDVRGSKMVIAGAGMMNGGRILHHAIRYLPDTASTLLIVGYQAHGTLGRKLYEGADRVEIFGETIPVRCAIRAIGALSAHADQKKLLSWIGSGGSAPKTVYCVHGEEHAATELAHRVRDVFPETTAYVPEAGEIVDVYMSERDYERN